MVNSNNAKVIYQVYSEGESVNGWKFRMRSKAVFGTRDAAEKFIPEFEDMCYDKNHFEHAVPGTLTTSITEYDYYE